MMATLRRLALFLFLSCGLVLEGRAAFRVEGRQLLRDGTAFPVQGVCYHPVPIKASAGTGPAWGDYCTVDFAALHARDLPAIRAMGANVVRVYGWAPGVDHRNFLDRCYNGGSAPVYVLVNRWIDPATDWNDAGAVAALTDQFAALESELAGHPAVLGILLGNETNVGGNGGSVAYWTAMDAVAAAIKARNPGRLVSVPVNDALADVAVAEGAGVSHIDFWSLQCYRGTTFGSLFADYAAVSVRPLVLTEFGMDAYDHRSSQPFPDNGLMVSDALASLWRNLQDNAATASGGCVFAWTDDWSRRGTGFVASGFPDGYADEGWWGLNAVVDAGAAVDVLAPRRAVARLSRLWQRSRLVALSARGSAGVGEQTLIMGFSYWAGGKPTLVRGVGPGISQSVGDYLRNPQVRLFTAGGGEVDSNDDWGGSPALSAVFAQTGASPLDTGSKDAVLYGPLSDSTYTVHVGGPAGASGVALAEVYDADLSDRTKRLFALSVRNQVGVGADILIAGFVIVGDAPKRVIVRGVGPGIASSVADYLRNPEIQVWRLNPSTGEWTLIAANDDWDHSVTMGDYFKESGMSSLENNSKDAALVLDLAPGVYTAHLSGVGASTGVGLAEVYELP